MTKTLVCEVRSGEDGLCGHVQSYEQMSCVTYWAERYTGRGDATIHYFARRADGATVRFRKQDNRHIRLLSAPDMKWGDIEFDSHHRHGPYRIYAGTIRRTSEYPL